MGVNWEVHSPDSASVTQMAWRPDGNVLAVAYESGRLQHLNLSDGSAVYTTEFVSTIQHLSWVSCNHEVTKIEGIFPSFDSLSVFTE